MITLDFLNGIVGDLSICKSNECDPVDVDEDNEEMARTIFCV